MKKRVCKTCGSENVDSVSCCAKCGQPLPASGCVRALYIGPVLLFLAASAYGILEAHPSTDVWIGLASGRQILTADEFPKHDTFSYTFHGEVWYNQNWLTHLAQYWLYSRISPNAVIYATWATSASVFVLVLLASYWRSGTWLGALLAASVVGLGCRDFLSARPATVGFLCIAGLWALLCALEGQREKSRWWPIGMLLPLLLVWGNAHGSFVLGYAILGLYVGHWLVVRTIRPRVAVSGRQVAAIVGVVGAALILTIAFGPFGVDNFTHGQKVAGSPVFRGVSEWLPPYRLGEHFPPVWRFWTILGLSLGTLLVGGLLALLKRGGPQRQTAGGGRHTSGFDVAVVVIGLSMALWARRFAPIYYIFAAPVVLTWIVLLLRPLGASFRQSLRRGVMAGAGLCAIPVAAITGLKAYDGLVRVYEESHPDFNLLERVTGYDFTPHQAILFLERNELQVNLLVEWPQAGVVMLRAPNAKVFMDGRAQQVYDETHYRRYYLLLVAQDTPGRLMMRLLDQHNTDAVLLRRWESPRNLETALDQSPDWVPALLDTDCKLFLRRDSRGLAQLGELLRGGREWWPDSALALASRGFVWQALPAPHLEHALTCWIGAVRRNVRAGSVCFRPITAALLKLGREPEAREFIERCYQTLNLPFIGVPERLQRELLEVLGECRRDIEKALDYRP